MFEGRGRFDAESLLEKELMEWLECLLEWPILVPAPEPDVHTALSLQFTNLWVARLNWGSPRTSALLAINC